MKKVQKILFVTILSCASVFTNCNKEDECADVTCYNGGVCDNGTCDCIEGYEGSSCNDQKTPSRISISEVRIKRFPQSDGGSSWDIGSGPDIFISLSKGSALFHTQPTYFENATSGNNYVYRPTPSIDLTDVTARYSINLYDYDTGSSDDWMGGIYFTPYYSDNEFPEIISVDAGAGLAFELKVNYVW
ncbi:MAG: hypothetical protein ABF260_10435 [Flavobacteriaceae bacterium]